MEKNIKSSHIGSKGKLEEEFLENPAIKLPRIYDFIELEKRGYLATDLPHVLVIEATNKCVLRCRTCPRTYFKLEKSKSLTWEEFLKIAEQFPSVERVVFAGIGEPLLNKKLPDMIKYFKERDVTVMVSSSAALLDAKVGQELIDSGLDELRCSIDGAKSDTYDKVCGVKLLQDVANNIRSFRAMQRAQKAELPKVSIWVTCIRENIADLPEMIRLAADIGVTEVNLNAMVYLLDSADPPGLMTSNQSVYVDCDQEAKHIISEAEAIAAGFNITLNTSGPIRPGMNQTSVKINKPGPWVFCLRPWSQVHVSANGNCLPCGIGPFASTDYDSLIMGNLFNDDFKEIWNNLRYKTWRKAVLSDQPPVPCSGCGVLWNEVKVISRKEM
ncbi:MAG: PqqA peptide cyclase [Syntrophus sp. SKADARSKE-3]|nr:PqqA peptide cyclase [Syntrophus sp. SKADARSKE-3]